MYGKEPGNLQSKRAFDVFLSDPAIDVLRSARKSGGGISSLIFPSPRGKPFSDAALSAVLRRMKVGAMPDGFRATFAEWYHDSNGYDHRILTSALGLAPEKMSAKFRFDLAGLEEKTRSVLEQCGAFCMNFTGASSRAINANRNSSPAHLRKT